MQNRIFLYAALCCLLFSGLSTRSVAQNEYEMLVSSRNTHSVKKFNAQTGDYIDDFISTGSGGLSYTQDLKIGTDGNVLVSGRGNTGILLYDKMYGDYIRQFTSGYVLDNPTKITFGPDGYLYVSQWGTTKNKIARFNGTSGVFIDEFTPSINLALGHEWDEEGNLYVACYGSKDVRMYDTSGNFIRIFTEAGHLQGPTNLWFDNNGNLLVIDWVLGLVQQFDSSGDFIKTFASGLTNAEGYAFGPDSSLYICDWTQNHIKRFSPDGSYLNIFTNQGNMMAPNSILIRPVQLTSVDDETGSIEKGFQLYQNFPNPFNPTTKIKFTVGDAYYASPARVMISAFNILGNEVATLVDEEKPSGTYTIQLDLSKHTLTSGIYFLRMMVNNYSQTIKMMYLK
ncbi:MAG: T9SS type A sorting domain-containing protein [Ignavibacteriales bacterium]|nr:MAG: T9SS type A sorting domain-containing protein [Ignavibacteriales bacterium]